MAVVGNEMYLGYNYAMTHCDHTILSDSGLPGWALETNLVSTTHVQSAQYINQPDVCVCVCVCSCACGIMYLDVHTCIDTCEHSYMHTYIHPCIHTYIHACTHRRPLKKVAAS